MVDADVRIRVVGTDRQPLPKAKVTLEPAGRGKGGHKLAYDRHTRSYHGRVPVGEYVVRAAAGGLRDEAHRVRVDPDGTTDVVILGKPDLPAYYLGKVRVPFEPLDGLVALTLDGTEMKRGDDVSARVLDAAHGLGIEPVDVPQAVLDDNVRVFKVADPRAVDDVVARLAGTRGVRRAGPVLHLDEQSVTYLSDEIVVRFRDHVEIDDVPRIAAEHGLEVERRVPYAGNAFVLRAPRPSLGLLAVLDRLVNTDAVDYAEPNLVSTVVLDFTPNDPQYVNQPHHPLIGSPAAWDVTLGSNAITIAVVDNGCEIAHPDFQNPVGTGWTKIVNPFDFTAYDSDPTSGVHGTRSCGIAAAVTNNATGVAGMAGGCRLMPMLYPSGATLTEFADAYIWAAGFDPHSTTVGFPAPIATGADVISNSFGRSEAALPATMKDTFDFLTTYGRGGKGCVVVFSTGNDNLDFTTYRQWAAYDRTIAVASSRISPPDPAETKVSTSNYGSKVDVCAPGGGPAGGAETRPMSTSDVDTYATHGQTSSACPQVAGTAALMLSANPLLTWTQVRSLLRSTAVHIDAANTDLVGQWVDTDGDGVVDFSQWYGRGRLAAGAAVAAASTYVAAYDILVRENLSDIGMPVPSTGAFWNSPDIWVRQLSPAADGAAALPAGYTSAGPTQPAKALQDNYVYVRLRNRGAGVSLPFYVRIYLAHFAGTEFTYPGDFIPSNRPGTTATTPLQPGTYLIGEVAHGPLAGGAEDLVQVTWPAALVPPEDVTVGGMSVHWHPCLLAEISPHDGPAASGNHVWDDNNLCQKNITVDYTTDDDSFAAFLVLGNAANTDRELELAVDRGKLPRNVDLWVRFVDPQVARRVRERLRGGDAPQAGPELHFVDGGRVEVGDAGDRHRLAFHVPAGTVLRATRAGLRPTAYEGLAPVEHAGRDVVRLPFKRGAHVPVPVSKGELVGVIVGGDVPAATPAGRYHVVVTQKSPEGVPTGSAGIEVRVGEKPE